MIAVTAVAMPPGISVKPVCVAEKPSRFCVNSGKMNTPPYKPKPSAMNRKIDPASCRFLRTRKFTTGCSLRGDSSHHSIVPSDDDREDRQADDERVREPILLAPFLEHVLQRGEPDDQQPDSGPVDRNLSAHPWRIFEERSHEKRRCDADRHVDEETPIPVVAIGDPSAERRPERRRDDDAEDEDGLHHPLLFALEDLPDRRLRGREQRRAARPLHDAPEHELAERLVDVPHKNDAPMKIRIDAMR